MMVMNGRIVAWLIYIAVIRLILVTHLILTGGGSIEPKSPPHNVSKMIPAASPP